MPFCRGVSRLSPSIIVDLGKSIPGVAHLEDPGCDQDHHDREAPRAGVGDVIPHDFRRPSRNTLYSGTQMSAMNHP